MKNNFSKIIMVTLIVSCCAGFLACKKTMDEYRNAKPKSEVFETTYGFLKQQGELYDTVVLLIDKLNLKDTLNDETVTFFVPQDISIKTAIENLNFTRKRLRKEPNWTLDSVPLTVWDTLMRRYIVRGIVTADSLRYADGADLETLYDYGMHANLSATNASGAVGGGTMVLVYSDKNKTRINKFWTPARTQNVDVRTKNGMMHILEGTHVFGFISFVGMSFPESLLPVQGPYLGYPAPIPGIIEAADYDEGGEGLAYHDNDASNNGGQYRGSEGVDIENCSEGMGAGDSPGGAYNVGWTGGGEWMNYTVDIKEAGTYDVETRFAGGGGDGRIRLKIDGVDVSGVIQMWYTGGWQNWAGVHTTVTLPAGIHVLRCATENDGFNVHRFIFKKL
jgi:hypothetical protein